MIAARIFGLEETVLETCTETEKRRFSLLAAAFIVLVTMSFLSLSYLFFLLFGTLWAALLTGFLIGFVYFNILRFSIISIGVPYSNEITFRKIILNSGNVTRLFIFSAFVFSICVPFVSYFYHDDITPMIDQYKAGIIAHYKNTKEKSKDQQLLRMKDGIEAKNNELRELLKNNSSDTIQEQRALADFQISKIKRQITELKNEYAQEEIDLNNLIAKDISKYEMELKRSEMPFMRFRYVFSNSTSTFLIIISFLLLMCIIPFYIHTLVNDNFEYSKKTHTQMTNLIQLKYDQCTDEIQRYLKDTFGYTEKISTGYIDAPFNTIPSIGAINKIDNIDIFTYFDDIDNGN